MAKKCRTCSRSYDDTWGVCLFCGRELREHREECDDICAEEGVDPAELLKRRRALRYVGALTLVLALAGLLLWASLAAGAGFFREALEKWFIRIFGTGAYS